jgi:hypothetical protein
MSLCPTCGSDPKLAPRSLRADMCGPCELEAIGNEGVYPGLVDRLTRADRIALLSWDDPDGCYTDGDHIAECGRTATDQDIHYLVSQMIDEHLDGDGWIDHLSTLLEVVCISRSFSWQDLDLCTHQLRYEIERRRKDNS